MLATLSDTFMTATRMDAFSLVPRQGEYERMADGASRRVSTDAVAQGDKRRTPENARQAAVKNS